MRGSTKKKIEKFVDELIKNTSETERKQKTKEQLIEEVKILWMKQGKKAQKFVDKVVKGQLNEG